MHSEFQEELRRAEVEGHTEEREQVKAKGSGEIILLWARVMKCLTKFSSLPDFCAKTLAVTGGSSTQGVR